MDAMFANHFETFDLDRLLLTLVLVLPLIIETTVNQFTDHMLNSSLQKLQVSAFVASLFSLFGFTVFQLCKYIRNFEKQFDTTFVSFLSLISIVFQIFGFLIFLVAVFLDLNTTQYLAHYKTNTVNVVQFVLVMPVVVYALMPVVNIAYVFSNYQTSSFMCTAYRCLSYVFLILIAISIFLQQNSLAQDDAHKLPTFASR